MSDAVTLTLTSRAPRLDPNTHNVHTCTSNREQAVHEQAEALFRAQKDVYKGCHMLFLHVVSFY